MANRRSSRPQTRFANRWKTPSRKLVITTVRSRWHNRTFDVWRLTFGVRRRGRDALPRVRGALDTSHRYADTLNGNNGGALLATPRGAARSSPPSAAARLEWRDAVG